MNLVLLSQKVKGTGRKGRILREDVQAYVKDAVKRAEAPAAGLTRYAAMAESGLQ
ncbi:E3 binding domain-containing protein [Providencia hangzhouensis]|uniref:E3 binding domain-containing protein n=1 Tax=Providencia hangzhouensis TaxID=3031799 RepID=UPI0034DD8F80